MESGITIVALVGVKDMVILLIMFDGLTSMLHETKKRTSEDILLVNIDEKSIEKYGQYQPKIYTRYIMGNITQTLMYSIYYSQNR